MSSSDRTRTAAAVTTRAFALVMLVTAFLLASFGVSYSADIPIATIPVGNAPAAVAVDPVTNRAFVCNYGGDSVSVIDGATHSVVATVSMPTTFAAGAFPIAVVTDPTRGLVYVANFWSHWIVCIDEASMTITRTAMVPVIADGYPRALALDPSSTPPKLYVANYGEGVVSVLNALTLATITEVPVGDGPRTMGIFTSAGYSRVWVGSRYSNDVTIIDAATDSVVGTIALAGPPKAIAVHPVDGEAWVTVPSADHVVCIGTTDSVVATVAVGDNPVGLGVLTSDDVLLVADYNSNDVAAIDTNTRSLIGTYPVGPGPFYVAVDQSDRKWHVTNYLGSTTNVLDRFFAVTTVTVGGTPYAIAVNEAVNPNEAYCSNHASDTVTVIDEPAPIAAAGPLAPAVAMAAGEDAGRLTVTVDDPGVVSPGVPLTFTGSVTGTTVPYELAIAAVWVRVDGGPQWHRATITGGAGTANVTWSADVAPVAAGPHTLGVMAMDQGMVVSASSAAEGSFAGGMPEMPAPLAFEAVYPETWAEETDPSLLWAGTWSTLARTQFWGGTAKYTSGAGKSVTVPFEGTSIDWIGARTSSGGKADVYLDGLWMGTVDQYASLNRFRQTMFASGPLAPGAHTLQVRSSGLKNRLSVGYTTWVDAFRVTGTIGP